jgi:hypothetical protein
MANLNETLVPSEGHNQDRELNDSGPSMRPGTDLLNNEIVLRLLLQLYLLELRHNASAFLLVIIQIVYQLFLVRLQVVNLFLQELVQLLLAAAVLVGKFGLDHVEYVVQLAHAFLVAVHQLLPDILVVALAAFELDAVVVETFYLGVEFLLGREETLVLFGEEVAGVGGDALDADVYTVCLAKEFDGFVVLSAELLVFATLLLLAGQLQGHEVLG